MELFKNTNFDFLGKKWPFIIASMVLTVAGLVSLIVKGGPKYGIDFKGGALIYVKFAQKPPQDRVRSALSAKLPGQVPDVVEVQQTNELIIGTEIQDEKSLNATRQTIIDTMAATFGGGDASKLDLNNTGQQALADRLRDPLYKANVGLGETQIQELAQGILTVRNTPPLSGIVTDYNQLSNVQGMNPQILNVLRQETFLAPYAIRNVEVVGPKIGEELRRQAMYVILSALGGMLIYIAFRFEWIYGVAAVLAVLHDTLITIGLFSIFDKEISLTVVAALLTLVGYSMNDTIVVFDRVRENLKIRRRSDLEALINESINQTLSRTILTSGLTLLTALALWLFGGPVLNGFSFALVVGIIIGTYSSIFIASPILIFWHNYMEKRRGVPAAAASAAAVRRAPAKSMK
jgi:preprotein translocase subunit SecF